MKDQYFGDVNDYIKYAVLRGLAAEGINVGICWMMTPDDGPRDGRKLGYLSRREAWESLDPVIFEFLKKVSAVRSRTVKLIERSGKLRGMRFFGHRIPDSRAERAETLNHCFEAFRDRNLVFFDPDNGMEIKSKPIGRKGSSKFLSWAEARRFYQAGQSIAFYQHFPRQKREVFLAGLRQSIERELSGSKALLIKTPNVAFCLAVQPCLEPAVQRMLWRVVPAIQGKISQFET